MTIRTTDDVEYQKFGLPIGTLKLMVTSETDDEQGRGIILTLECVEGAHRGATGQLWLLFNHDNIKARKAAEEKMKRIADATGKQIPLCSIAQRPASFAPIKGRVFVGQVEQQKNNPDYTEVKRFYPENYSAPAADEAPF